MPHDVFVSYAHVDDKPLPGAAKGWVTTFVEGLKNKLAQEMGRDEAFRLWVDYELRGNDAVTPKIHEILDGAGTLVLFLSQGYLESAWCREELARFVTRVGAGAGRVFVVYRSPVDAIPESLSDLMKYEFWAEDDAGQPRTLAEPVPDPTDRTYYDRQEDLARDLATEIRKLQAAGQEPVVPPAPPPEPGPEPAAPPRCLVFVNAGDDDLDLAREIAKCLTVRGFGFVLPLAAVPDFDASTARAAELRRDRHRNLKGCDAVLMLFRAGPVNQVREHLSAWHTTAAQRKIGPPALALFQENPDPMAVGAAYPDMQVHVVTEFRADDCARQFAEAFAARGGAP